LQLILKCGHTLAEHIVALEMERFSPYATVSADCGKTDISIPISSFTGVKTLVTMGTYAVWDNEIVRVDSINTATLLVGVGRGCLDTVPQLHNPGSKLIFCEGKVAADQNEYLMNESVQAKLLTRTGSGLLFQLPLPLLRSLTFVGRFISVRTRLANLELTTSITR
jgi:hypothetical protein